MNTDNLHYIYFRGQELYLNPDFAAALGIPEFATIETKEEVFALLRQQKIYRKYRIAVIATDN
ncbi:hypothetical protein [Larkinella terrae]|uniref:Uncharacterized protein n=1 Tax=Larkinella terrae TaxID=2025311 RepID=A0A7K0EIY0_9BACT|nr:hypothetical protein [Larkinella terrae]MRS61803.1 hypothetical protein [Larkinella terrae]